MLSGDVYAESGIELAARAESHAALEVAELSCSVLPSALAPVLLAAVLLPLLLSSTLANDVYSLLGSLSGLCLTLRLPYVHIVFLSHLSSFTGFEQLPRMP